MAMAVIIALAMAMANLKYFNFVNHIVVFHYFRYNNSNYLKVINLYFIIQIIILFVPISISHIMACIIDLLHHFDFRLDLLESFLNYLYRFMAYCCFNLVEVTNY